MLLYSADTQGTEWKIKITVLQMSPSQWVLPGKILLLLYLQQLSAEETV